MLEVNLEGFKLPTEEDMTTQAANEPPWDTMQHAESDTQAALHAARRHAPKEDVIKRDLFELIPARYWNNVIGNGITKAEAELWTRLKDHCMRELFHKHRHAGPPAQPPSGAAASSALQPQPPAAGGAAPQLQPPAAGGGAPQHWRLPAAAAGGGALQPLPPAAAGGGATPSHHVERLCVHKAQNGIERVVSQACNDIRVSFCVPVLKREWQVLQTLPLNLWFAHAYRNVVRFVLVVFGDHAEATELVKWIFAHWADFVLTGMLVVVRSGREHWHASVCKNSVHKAALLTPWKGEHLSFPYGDRHCLVNLDCDNILIESGISTLLWQLSDLPAGPRFLLWLVAVPRCKG